eukprot:TRINITY_DN24566_c0_g1_i1.p2 TRINITY_DN24566_c0_g1~~TRINITY_DN24566_c0_g1_i1.p2  ORF type:complete len:114 (+),score=2.25 TRINITY_DN24566_c0_g1_i1:137-478(+)
MDSKFVSRHNHLTICGIWVILKPICMNCDFVCLFVNNEVRFYFYFYFGFGCMYFIQTVRIFKVLELGGEKLNNYWKIYNYKKELVMGISFLVEVLNQQLSLIISIDVKFNTQY